MFVSMCVSFGRGASKLETTVSRLEVGPREMERLWLVIVDFCVVASHSLSSSDGLVGFVVCFPRYYLSLSDLFAYLYRSCN